jgi:hypothetical protein
MQSHAYASLLLSARVCLMARHRQRLRARGSVSLFALGTAPRAEEPQPELTRPLSIAHAHAPSAADAGAGPAKSGTSSSNSLPANALSPSQLAELPVLSLLLRRLEAACDHEANPADPATFLRVPVAGSLAGPAVIIPRARRTLRPLMSPSNPNINPPDERVATFACSPCGPRQPAGHARARLG